MNEILNIPLPSLEVTILWIVKALFLAGAFLYLIFSLLVTRQIDLMKKTLITSMSGTITLFGWLHLLIALLVFIFFIILL